MKRVIHASHYSELTYDQAIQFFFTFFIFLTWRRTPCLRQKVNDRGKIHLITGKPAAFYNLLRVSAVLQQAAFRT